MINKVKKVLKDNGVTFIETQEPNTIFFVEELYFVDYLFGICDTLGVCYEVLGRDFQNQQVVTVELSLPTPLKTEISDDEVLNYVKIICEEEELSHSPEEISSEIEDCRNGRCTNNDLSVCCRCRDNELSHR